MANLFGQLPPFDVNNDIPKSFLNVLQELYHDGRLTSWKVRGRGDILSVRLTWFDPDHRNACIKAKARQHLGEIIVILNFFFYILADLDELDDDLGYGTLRTNDSKDPGWFYKQIVTLTICRGFLFFNLFYLFQNNLVVYNYIYIYILLS